MSCYSAYIDADRRKEYGKALLWWLGAIAFLTVGFLMPHR